MREFHSHENKVEHNRGQTAFKQTFRRGASGSEKCGKLLWN